VNAGGIGGEGFDLGREVSVRVGIRRAGHLGRLIPVQARRLVWKESGTVDGDGGVDIAGGDVEGDERVDRRGRRRSWAR